MKKICILKNHWIIGNYRFSKYHHIFVVGSRKQHHLAGLGQLPISKSRVNYGNSINVYKLV